LIVSLVKFLPGCHGQRGQLALEVFQHIVAMTQQLLEVVGVGMRYLALQLHQGPLQNLRQYIPLFDVKFNVLHGMPSLRVADYTLQAWLANLSFGPRERLM
jgi:hypothetical protein